MTQVGEFMGIIQKNQGALSHSHRDRTENTVLFKGILETLEVLIGDVENLELLEVLIVKIGNTYFQANVGSVERKDTGGLSAQK